MRMSQPRDMRILTYDLPTKDCINNRFGMTARI